MPIRPLLACLCVTYFVGCTGSPATPSTTPDITVVTGLPPEQVNLVIGDEKNFAELVAAHQGKVVFVDFWATWCGPCVEGFPHSVELSRKHKDAGLATIAVSFDLLEKEADVREFLAKQGADFENMLSKYDGANQEAAEGFEMSALPQYRLYDRTGQLRYRWEADAEELKQPGILEAKIAELLAEK